MRRARPYAAVAAIVILLAAYWLVQRWADHREATAPPTTNSVAPPTTNSPSPTRTSISSATRIPTTAAPIPGVPTRPADAIEMVMLYTYDGDTIQARATAPSKVITTTNPIRIRIVGFIH